MLIVRDTELGIVDRVADLKRAAQGKVGLDLIVVILQEYRSTFSRVALATPCSRRRGAYMQRDRFMAANIRLANPDVDLEVAAELVERFPSRACFHVQQAAELVLKAALIALTDDHPRAQSGGVLILEIEAVGRDVPGDIAAAANRLDSF